MRIQILAVPYDSARRGWRMGAGPEHLLAHGIPAQLEAAGHSVAVAVVEPRRDAPAEIATAFDLMSRVSDAVRAAVRDRAFPLVLSGNCNSAVGTLSGLTPGERSVFWFDAHGDANTPETTTTGFLDGMSLAAAMGWCWRGLTAQVPGFEPVRADRVMLLGARDLDPEEKGLLDAADVKRLSPAGIVDGRLGRALATAPDGAAYVHCDLDVLDPSEGQANPFPTPGGLRATELEQAIAAIGGARAIAAAAVTAYAPEYDADNRVLGAAMRIVTAIIAAVRVE
jgi:arginase